MNDEVEDIDADPTTPGRRSRLRLAVAGAVAVAVVVTAVWVRAGLDDDDGLDEARRVAVEFGAAYLSFDASSVDLAGDELLALATDRFAAEFRSDRLPSVSELFADSSTSTRAEVREVFLAPEADGRLRAVLLVDVDASASEGSQRLINLSFVIELVDEEGWKVDGVSPLPAPEVLGPPAPGTSTTGPPPTTPSPGAPTTTTGG